MYKYVLINIIFSLHLFILHSQNYLVNTGCIVSIPQGTKMHLNGSLINQNTGYFINEDTVYITGDITHSASNNLFQNNGKGTVLLIGNNQEIDGTSVPNFNNLSLQGSGIKNISVDIRVKGFLYIKDKEFALGNNTLFIDNIDTTAINRTTGYISTDASGFMQRAIGQKGNYLFPTGWTSTSKNYRPIVINAPNANPDTFKVNLVSYPATIDGYDLNNKENILCKINDKFYHNIERLTNNLSQVQLSFYFDTLFDGVFDRIAHWQGSTPQWQNTSTPSSLSYFSSPNLSEISIIKWNNFNPTPFALALSNPAPAITATTPLCENSSSFNLSANIQGGTWLGSGIVDPVNGTFDPQLSGPGMFTVYYNVSNYYACSATDSTTIIVESPAIASFNSSTPVGGDVIFTNNSVNATDYYWDFGDGNFSSDVSPNHTYNANGNYTVILYSSNSCNTDSTFQVIDINNVGIDENSANQNVFIYPNPINNNSVITVSINKKSSINIDLLTVTGEIVKTIIDENILSEGNYNYNIEPSLLNYVAGVYIVRVKLNDIVYIKRIIYL